MFAYLCAPPICVSILAEASDPSGRFFRSGLSLGLARFLLGLHSAWFAQSNAISLLDGVFSISSLHIADSQSQNTLDFI